MSNTNWASACNDPDCACRRNHNFPDNLPCKETSMKHDPWTQLTDMAAAHIESCIRAENRPAVEQLLSDLCNNTKQKRDVLVDFLCTKPIKE